MFQGFPQAGVQFLRDLAQNNNKAWFEANKKIYQEALQAPALSLVEALGERLSDAFPPITYDTRKTGGSLMRIHRDTRFSPDKTPYKTNIAMMFAPEGYQRMAAPGFGLQMTTEQVELVAGLFSFDKDQLERFRQAVTEEREGAALGNVVAQMQAAGDYTLGGKELKRVPRGYDPAHPRAEWLKYKGLHAFAPPISLDVAQTPDLMDVVMHHFQTMAPLQGWLMRALDI